MLRRLAARFPDRYPLLLDSAASGPLSRASVLLAEPDAALWLGADGRLGAQGFVPQGTSFLAALENWWLAERSAPPANAQPDTAAGELAFEGGWAVFLGYELAQEIEPHLALPRSPLPWQAFALRTPCALVHDLERQRVFAVAEARAADALARIAREAREAALEADARDTLRIEQVHEEDPRAYLARVRRAQEYVRAGDIYQANLSRPWAVQIRGSAAHAQVAPAAALYRRLCAANPAPFAALAQWRGVAILSSSPERLVRIVGRRIDTRPIAGTRPRSRRPGGDRHEMTELAAHPKERAEHIMLIDLERNDLGRVCEPGTVRVDEFMTIESYTHVHHIVSNVTGELKGEVTQFLAAAQVT